MWSLRPCWFKSRPGHKDMNDISLYAYVVDKYPSGEIDERVVLFTREFGKLSGFLKSGRKINGKLSAHLQILNKVVVRIVEKNKIQVVDALKQRSLESERGRALTFFRLLNQLVSEGEPDLRIWDLLEKEDIDIRKLLKFSGFDPEHANCARCEIDRINYFLSSDQLFYCDKCLKEGDRNGWVFPV